MVTPARIPSNESPESLPTQLRQVLEATTSREVSERILRRSLTLAGIARLPTDPGDFRVFVNDSLRQVLTQIVGVHVSNAVLEGLRPLVESVEEDNEELEDQETSDLFRFHIDAANTQIQRVGAQLRELRESTKSTHLQRIVGNAANDDLETASPSSQPAARRSPQGMTAAVNHPPPQHPLPKQPHKQATSERSAILVASTDYVGVRRALSELRPSLLPQSVQNLDELEAELQTRDTGHPIVLLDCSMPTLQLSDLLARKAALLHAKRVVLWGVTPRKRQEMESAIQADQRWVMLPMFVGYHELAETLVNLAEDI